MRIRSVRHSLVKLAPMSYPTYPDVCESERQATGLAYRRRLDVALELNAVTC